jgi:hypothetical protein
MRSYNNPKERMQDNKNKREYRENNKIGAVNFMRLAALNKRRTQSFDYPNNPIVLIEGIHATRNTLHRGNIAVI